MENTYIHQELIHNAKQIQHALEYFNDILKVLEPATHYLKENQAICHAIGVDAVESYASQLEIALQEATDRGLYLSVLLKETSAEYVNAIIKCGVPTTADLPELRISFD